MPLIPAMATSNENKGITYNEMVSAIYAGQAIERLPLNRDICTVKDIVYALGCLADKDAEKLIYDTLWDRGYRAHNFGSGNQYKFTYAQAIAAIRIVAPELLEKNEHKP